MHAPIILQFTIITRTLYLFSPIPFGVIAAIRWRTSGLTLLDPGLISIRKILDHFPSTQPTTMSTHIRPHTQPISLLYQPTQSLMFIHSSPLPRQILAPILRFLSPLRFHQVRVAPFPATALQLSLPCRTSSQTPTKMPIIMLRLINRNRRGGLRIHCR